MTEGNWGEVRRPWNYSLGITPPRSLEAHGLPYRGEGLQITSNAGKTRRNRMLTLSMLALALPSLSLWYDKPAANWNEALPVGNGRLGAMVFGGVAEERLQLNDDTLWAGHIQDRHNPKALEALPQVRKLIFDGKNEEAARLAGQTMMGVPPTVQSYQTLGDLHLSQKLKGEATGYRRWLDLDAATVTTEFTVGKTRFRREVFSSHPDRVIVIRLTATGPARIDLDVTLDRPENFTTVSRGQDGLVMSGRAGKDGVQYEAALRARADGYLASGGGRLNVRGAKEVVITLAAATDYNFRDPAKPLKFDAKPMVDQANKKPIEDLTKKHLADYRSLFRRVNLDLGPQDPRPTNERREETRPTRNTEPQQRTIDRPTRSSDSGNSSSGRSSSGSNNSSNSSSGSKSATGRGGRN